MLKVNTKQELDLELKKNKQIIALFYASWCPYCLRFVPIFEESITNLDFGKVLHVILDDYDNPLWDDYNVVAVPTIIIFQEGKISKRLDGRLGSGLKEERFRIWLDELKH